MVPIGKVSSAAAVGAALSSAGQSGTPDTASSTQRALVPAVNVTAIEPGISRPGPATGRATAPFLTHLIATAAGVPQTRVRRRADPNWAATAYAATMQAPAVTGRSLRESH